MKTLPQIPQGLEGFLPFSCALAGGKLDQKVREQIALAVAQANLCEYSLAYHTTIARKLGLSDNEILASREGRAADSRIEAALRFARELVAENGDSSTEELQRVGFSDGEMVDIVALVGLNVF